LGRTTPTNPCDEWLEGEDAWHLGWKRMVKPDFVEVPIGGRMADIARGPRAVLLRRGSLKEDDYRERVNSSLPRAGGLAWIWDMSRRTRLNVDRSHAGRPKLSISSAFVPFMVKRRAP
jgi:hypothetical protein